MHVEHSDPRARRRFCFLDGRVDRDAFEFFAGLLGIHARDEAIPAVRVVAARARVELAGLASDALRDDLGALAYQDAHAVPAHRRPREGRDPGSAKYYLPARCSCPD